MQSIGFDKGDLIGRGAIIWTIRILDDLPEVRTWSNRGGSRTHAHSLSEYGVED